MPTSGGCFYVGRHSHADINQTTSPAWGGDSSLKGGEFLSCLFFWGPKRNAPARRQRIAALPTLFGGKGFLCRSASPCRHQPNHLPRLGRGLLLEKEESFYPVYFFGGQKETPPRGGKGLPPYFYRMNEGLNYHKTFSVFSHKTNESPKSCYVWRYNGNYALAVRGYSCKSIRDDLPSVQ